MSKKLLSRLANRSSQLLLILSASALLLMTFIIGWQVFGRFVLGSSPSWSEQAALTLMIWFVFLAGAAGVKEKFHIRIIALENALSASPRKKMQLMSHVIVGLCGLAMLWWGGELVVRTWSHIIPSLGLPRGVAYLAIPITGALISLFSLDHILHPEKDVRADTGQTTPSLMEGIE